MLMAAGVPEAMPGNRMMVASTARQTPHICRCRGWLPATAAALTSCYDVCYGQQQLPDRYFGCNPSSEWDSHIHREGGQHQTNLKRATAFAALSYESPASSTAFPGRAQPSARASSDRCLSQLSCGCSFKSTSITKQPSALLFLKHGVVAAQYGQAACAAAKKADQRCWYSIVGKPLAFRGVSIRPPGRSSKQR